MVDAEICACHTGYGVYKQVPNSISLCIGLCGILVLGCRISPPNAERRLGACTANTCYNAPGGVCSEYGNWNTPLDGGVEPSTETVFCGLLPFSVTLVVDMGLVIAPVIAWYTESLVLFVGLITTLAGVFVVSYKWGISNLRRLLVAQS